MTTIYVLDTETTTTNFSDPAYDYQPNGHIVEFGMTRVDLDLRTIGPTVHYVFDDPDATGEEWVYKNTDLPFRQGVSDSKPFVDGLLAVIFEGKWVTCFNHRFDQALIRRDMPRFFDAICWAPDIMLAADRIADIPRKKHDTDTGWKSYPSVQATWDYLFPETPQEEKHRAVSDAIQEAKILQRLVDMGLYDLGGIQ